MPLIPHICANCHGQIQFDDSRDSGFCPYCGTAYTREDVIVNQNVTINVDGSNLNVKDENWYKTSTYQFLVDGYFGKANDYAMEYYENYPTSESARKCQENISTIFDLFINKELFAPTYAFESHSYRLNPNRDENTCCLPTSIFEDTFNNHINKITDLVKSMDFPDDRFLNHLVNELNYTKSCEFERSLNIERYISEDNLSDAIQAELKKQENEKASAEAEISYKKYKAKSAVIITIAVIVCGGIFIFNLIRCIQKAMFGAFGNIIVMIIALVVLIVVIVNRKS